MPNETLCIHAEWRIVTNRRHLSKITFPHVVCDLIKGPYNSWFKLPSLTCTTIYIISLEDFKRQFYTPTMHAWWSTALNIEEKFNQFLHRNIKHYSLLLVIKALNSKFCLLHFEDDFQSVLSSLHTPIVCECHTIEYASIVDVDMKHSIYFVYIYVYRTLQSIYDV